MVDRGNHHPLLNALGESMRTTSILLPLFIAGAAACSSSALPTAAPSGSDPSSTGSLLEPPPAGKGQQLTMTTTLEAGQEIERVQFFQVPPGGLYVNRAEVRFSPGSHHVLLYRTPYTSIPTVDVHGKTQNTSTILDAPSGGTADWKIDGVVAGAQSADAPPLLDGLPPNVAVKIEGGTVLLMNTHYLNATTKPISVEARINLWSLPKEQVTVEAGILFYYDPIIHLAPRSTGYAEMSCPVQADITVVNLQTHMHRRGVGGEAFVLPPGSTTPEKIYESDAWEAVPVKTYAPNMPIKSGSWMNYHCNYKNNEDRSIIQGLSTKDEMCMLIGVYYPKDTKTELCSVDGTYDHISSAGIWAGKDGTATCIQSMDCLGSASAADGAYECILNACPKAAKPLNETFKCINSESTNCKLGCAGAADPRSCAQTCAQKACASLLKTCTYATCE